MTYHLSSEQYRRGIDYIARARLEAVRNTMPGQPSASSAVVLGMAEMLAQLAGPTTPAARVMRDSDARLADLDSPLGGVNGTNPVCDRYDESYDGTGCAGCGRSLGEHHPVVRSRL